MSRGLFGFFSNQENSMNTEWNRYASFQNFPLDVPVSAVRLAANGFFYSGQGDKVQCFSCSITYSDWKEGDVPSEIHGLLSPTCDFVRGTDGNNIPIHDRQMESGTQIRESRHEREENNGNTQSKFPEFENGTNRASTFDEWTNTCVCQTILTDAGFFYSGCGDLVRCFSCGGALRDWAESDDPWVEHARWFPWCAFLLQQKGNQFIRNHTNLDNTGSANDLPNELLNHSSSEQDSHENKDESGKAGSSGGQLIDKASSQVAKREVGPNGDSTNKESKETGELDNGNVQKELEELKDKYLCKICKAKEINIVFLPCSHMVACESCAPQIAKCAVCRGTIKNRKKIFIS